MRSNQPRHFEASALVEYADGSGSLMVRNTKGEPLEIHFAPNIYADVGFKFFQKFSHQQPVHHEVKERE